MLHTYLIFYCSDLEHSAMYYCCCCMLYATPHHTVNIIPTTYLYVWATWQHCCCCCHRPSHATRPVAGSGSPVECARIPQRPSVLPEELWNSEGKEGVYVIRPPGGAMKASCGGHRRPCYSWSQRPGCQLPVLSCSLQTVEVTTCSRAVQPLYHRAVTSLPIDSSNRNLAINWFVKSLLTWVYSTVRGYDTQSVHHRQAYHTTWRNFTKGYPTWMYLVPGISRESGARHDMGWPWVDYISISNVIVARLLCA